MGLPSKQQVLASKKLRLEKVPTPGWASPDQSEPCWVYVKEMTARERDAWEVSVSAKGDGLDDDAAKEARMVNFSASLCAATICDESGKLLFSAADVEALGEIGSSDLKRCYRAATKLNGMDDKELAELEKNSEAAHDTSSLTS